MRKPEAPTAEEFRTAFLALTPRLTETRRKLLRTHFNFRHHQATMTQISEAMGWKSYSSGNAHYGKLAQLVGEQVGFHTGSCHLNVLATFIEPEEPGDHWLIIMRPQVADALKQLNWV
jgi:hypothetical protein